MSKVCKRLQFSHCLDPWSIPEWWLLELAPGVARMSSRPPEVSSSLQTSASRHDLQPVMLHRWAAVTGMVAGGFIRGEDHNFYFELLSPHEAADRGQGCRGAELSRPLPCIETWRGTVQLFSVISESIIIHVSSKHVMNEIFIFSRIQKYLFVDVVINYIRLNDWIEDSVVG